MSLRFIGEIGVYKLERDAIKITAADGDRIVDCYVLRSALRAAKCAVAGDPTELIRRFQKNRDVFEIAAMAKYRRMLSKPIELEIDAGDLASVLPGAAA